MTYPNTPGWKEAETSKDAAESVRDRARILREAALALIEEVGLTSDEIAQCLGESVLSIRPRVSELRRMKLVTKSGLRRANASGRMAHVWKIA